MRVAVASALVFAVVLATSGCGSDDETPASDSSSVDVVVNQLPDDAYGFSAMDVVAAREAVGVPAEFDPETIIDTTPEERRVASDLALALPYLSKPDESPVKEAIDETAIEAAATTGTLFGPTAGAVISTTQPFEEIASSLEGSGYEPDGDILVTDELAQVVTYTAIGDAGDGIVVMATEAATAESMLAGPPADANSEAKALDASLDAPFRSVAPLESATCVQGIAMEDDLTDGSGEWVVSVEGEPDPASFLPPESSVLPFSTFEFEAGEVDGELLRVPFTYPLEEPGAPATVLAGDLPIGTIYRC